MNHCHLLSTNPSYQRQEQKEEKITWKYWNHALSRNMRFFNTHGRYWNENLTKEKSMVESRFNVANSAIEDKYRMDTEFYKQHEIQFSCNS